ncbi:hypothetical protein F4808DRAFT_101705 [Astrocystis sublimbata]|nr:hypothetical protein F4808DRAFT_101705 [Astrocystis sublimbata]
MAASLAAALPKPRYTGEDEELPAHAQQRGPRILGPGQMTSRRSFFAELARPLTNSARAGGRGPMKTSEMGALSPRYLSLNIPCRWERRGPTPAMRSPSPLTEKAKSNTMPLQSRAMLRTG